MYRLVASHHAVILINLCLALIVANIVFLAGVDKTWLYVRITLRHITSKFSLIVQIFYLLFSHFFILDYYIFAV